MRDKNCVIAWKARLGRENNGELVPVLCSAERDALKARILYLEGVLDKFGVVYAKDSTDSVSAEGQRKS